jgi:hypothetical protein
MIIELKDLNVGDEIMVGQNSNLMWLKVLVQPHLSTKRPTTWRGDRNYVAVKCSTRVEEKTYTYNYSGGTHTYKRTVYVPTPFDHNLKKTFDLNGRTLWLMKRQEK